MKEYLWFVGMDTGYAGSGDYDVLVHEAITDENEDLCKCVWEMALENAQSYGIERYCGNCEACYREEWDECEDSEEGIEGWCVLYNPKEHDRYRSGGGSFLSEYPEAELDEELQAYYISG